jgi:hypothetical protein
MISVLDANDTEQAAESNKNGTLWSWGSSPKGSQIVDGMLVEDPRYSLKKAQCRLQLAGRLPG